MDIKLYTDIPLVKDLVSIYGDNVKIHDHIDNRILELYLQFRNNDPPIHITNEDIYDYIKFIHFILMDNDHYIYISKYITKDNFYFFENLFENHFIENDLLLLLNYDVVRLYPFYKNIESKYVIENFHYMMKNNKDVLYKYIVYECKYTYCKIDSTFYVYVHNNFKHGSLFKDIPINWLSNDLIEGLSDDFISYSENELPELDLIKYMISLGVNNVDMLTLTNFLNHKDIVKFLIEEVMKSYNIFCLLDLCVYLGYSDTLCYLASVGDKELNLNHITTLTYDDFYYINNKTNVKMIECLLDIGVNLLDNNYTILFYFIKNKNIDIIKKLLKVFKDVENNNNILLVKYIIDTNDANVLKAFEETGFNFKINMHFNIKYCQDNDLKISLKYILKAVAK